MACPARSVRICQANHAANDPIEDTAVIQETDKLVYAGVFDGHGGNKVSKYIEDQGYDKFCKYLKAMHDPGKALAHSFLETDACWLKIVKSHMAAKHRDTWNEVTVGSCAVAAVFDKDQQRLVVANLGDSRCVVGSICSDSGILEAVEMSKDHSATTDSERLRIRTEHASDPHVIKEQWDEIVEEYAWFLKNRARFTRSIGDSCMKDVECARFYNERVPDGLAKMIPLPKKPYVSNKAEVRVRRVAKGDQFVIVACDGLWDEMSSDQAVHTVRHLIDTHGARENIAQLLIDFCLVKIVRRLRAEEPDLNLNTIADLKEIPPGGYGRRGLHDDITVIVMIYDSPENAKASSGKGALPAVAGASK